MAVMTESPVVRGPVTKAELAELPDDGRRNELLDGVLIVTPAPSPRHQRAVLLVAQLLEAVRPPELLVLTAPLDVDISPDTLLQPDVVVVHRQQVGAKKINGAPLLAVEVLSRSTRRFDLHLKRARYEAAGTPSYWVVDPGEPTSLRAWELQNGKYVEVASVSYDDPFVTERPFPLTVVPDQLVDL